MLSHWAFLWIETCIAFIYSKHCALLQLLQRFTNWLWAKRPDPPWLFSTSSPALLTRRSMVMSSLSSEVPTTSKSVPLLSFMVWAPSGCGRGPFCGSGMSRTPPPPTPYVCDLQAVWVIHSVHIWQVDWMSQKPPHPHPTPTPPWRPPKAIWAKNSEFMAGWLLCTWPPSPLWKQNTKGVDFAPQLP